MNVTIYLVDSETGQVKASPDVIGKSGYKGFTLGYHGSREGVEVGRTFKVGAVDELVDPDTGEVLDSEMTEVGTIKVTKTKEKISYCAPVSGAGKMQKGMSVFPMNH